MAQAPNPTGVMFRSEFPNLRVLTVPPIARPVPATKVAIRSLAGFDEWASRKVTSKYQADGSRASVPHGAGLRRGRSFRESQTAFSTGTRFLRTFRADLREVSPPGVR